MAILSGLGLHSTLWHLIVAQFLRRQLAQPDTVITQLRRVCAPTELPLFNSCSAAFSWVTSIHSDHKSTRTSFNAFLEELLEELVLLVAHSQGVVSFSLFFFLSCPPSATMLAYIALLGVLLLVCLWCCAVTMGSPNMAGEAPV